MKKPVLFGILFFLLVLGVLVYSSMNLSGKRVEVCVAFRGATACRTASGSTEEFALRTATSNACAQIASGVTDSIACENAPPVKITWLK
ncbi:MAG TPA: hypothetical protein VN841_25170 [Bryobacteraceae bacterium]|nr:hypothetical protein [Bryobacteraceae bacterium]